MFLQVVCVLSVLLVDIVLLQQLVVLELGIDFGCDPLHVLLSRDAWSVWSVCVFFVTISGELGCRQGPWWRGNRLTVNLSEFFCPLCRAVCTP